MFSKYSDDNIRDQGQDQEEQGEHPDTDVGEEDQGDVHHVRHDVIEVVEGVAHEVDGEEDDEGEDDGEDEGPADGPRVEHELDADHHLDRK